MSERIPPIECLQALVSAGRSGSFKEAAAELGISPSAVSHRIATLEDSLNLRLFVRGRRGMVLTDEGARYLLATKASLDQLDLETDRIRNRRVDSRLNLRVPATFGLRWLMPRLSEYTKRYPKMDIDIVSTNTPVDFSKPETDIAIAFGTGDWPGYETNKLVGEEIMPVRSPSYVEQHSLRASEKSLSHYTLIHCANRPDEWSWWFKQAGIEGPVPVRRHNMSTCEMAVESAAAGFGIALGRRPLINDEIAHGRLIKPFGESYRTNMAYYFVSPPEKSSLTRVAEFRRWLIDQCTDQRFDNEH